MNVIELDQEYFDSIKNKKRDDIINQIIVDVIHGETEYRGTSYNFVLQDLVNDAMGEEEVCEAMKDAVINNNCDNRAIVVEKVNYAVSCMLVNLVSAMCNNEEIGIA